MRLPHVTRAAALVYAAALGSVAVLLAVDGFRSDSPRVAMAFASAAWLCAVGCAAYVACVFDRSIVDSGAPAPPSVNGESAREPMFSCVTCGEDAVYICRRHGTALCRAGRAAHDINNGHSCLYDYVAPAAIEGVYGSKA